MRFIINKFKYDLGMNQKDLADILDCSPAFIAMVASGERLFPDSMLKKLINIGEFSEKDINRIMKDYLKSVSQIKFDLQGLSLKKRREILEFKWRYE